MTWVEIDGVVHLLSEGANTCCGLPLDQAEVVVGGEHRACMDCIVSVAPDFDPE